MSSKYINDCVSTTNASITTLHSLTKPIRSSLQAFLVKTSQLITRLVKSCLPQNLTREFIFRINSLIVMHKAERNTHIMG